MIPVPHRSQLSIVTRSVLREKRLRGIPLSVSDSFAQVLDVADKRVDEVRQIPALMPLAKAFSQFFDGRFPTPFALGPDQLEQAGVVRRGALGLFRIVFFHRVLGTRPSSRFSLTTIGRHGGA